MSLALVAALISGVMGAATAKLIAVRPNVSFPDAGQSSTTQFGPYEPGSKFKEAIVSWNVDNAAKAGVLVQARAVDGDYKTKWYTMGDWAADAQIHPRVSVDNQKDADGTVNTDTLSLSRPFSGLEISVTMNNFGQAEAPKPILKFLSTCFSELDGQLAAVATQPATSIALGKEIDVPERAQNNYPNGGVLCSATSVSMLLWYYSKSLNRPELNQDVPAVEAGVWDSVYKGAGNWPFNMAYAGSFPGMRAYIARFNGVPDLQTWIAAGFPVACSVSFDMLRGKPLSPTESGHLIVLVGFSKNGDPIVNDPAFTDQVRKSYPLADFIKAWDYSNRTVYLVYPETATVPPAIDGLWDGG